MKPLDLERFEGATAGRWKPFIKGRTVAIMSEDNKQVISWTGFDGSDFSLNEQAKNAQLIAAAPQLLAELKALRAWREAVSKAILKWSTEPMHEDVDGVLIGAFFDAETELHDGKF